MPNHPIAVSVVIFVMKLSIVTVHAATNDVGPIDAPVFDLTKEERSLLSEDRTVVRVSPDRHGDTAAVVFGSIEIDAPQSVVWDLMLDCDRAPELVPGLTSCKVIESGPDGQWDIREHRINFSIFYSNVVNIFRSDYIPDKEIRFHLVGGDLKTQEGTWRLEATSADQTRTRVLYRARLAVGKPVPRFLVRRSIRKDFPKVLRSLKDAAEKAVKSADAG